MKPKVISSTTVKAMRETPATAVWLSNIDVIMPSVHVPNVYVYEYSGAHDFFNSTMLKKSLSETLVEFYPLAGRLEEVDGRIQINCNGEGVLFVNADCDAALLDFIQFIPRPDISLVPKVDYSKGISTYPLLLVQVTRFSCGGVCMGVATEHHTMDGFSVGHFMNTWAEIARGYDVTIKPFLDRRIMSARNPLRPQFPHEEYLPPPIVKNPRNNSGNSQLVFKMLKLTRDQLDALNSKCQGGATHNVKYTSFEMLAGHVWRCVSKARGFPEDQETKLYIPVNGRYRLRPPIPLGYFGNLVFKTTTMALCGELKSNPLEFAVRKVHEAIARVDDDYLRSAIDYLEMNLKVDPRVRGMAAHQSPTLLGVVDGTKLGFRNIDFGWGCPINIVFDGVSPEGIVHVMPGPTREGSLFLAIALPKEQMQLFENLCYGREAHPKSNLVQLHSRC